MVFTLKHQEQKRFITLVPLHGKLYSTVNPEIKTLLRLKIPDPLNKLSLLFLLFFSPEGVLINWYLCNT